MRKVLPEARLIPMTADHPIFDSFYRINALEYFGAAGTFNGLEAQFFGIFEDNDPKKRLMAIVNYNFDVSEFWEYSGQGHLPHRSDQRSLQARRQLPHLRLYPLIRKDAA